MWWWNFNKEEPLQEDLVVYETFMEIKEDRQRMNEEKERQKAAARSRAGRTAKSNRYSIPDPVAE